MNVRRNVVFLVVSVVLVVGTFVYTVQSNKSPVLGLDLQGGTSVVLSPVGKFSQDSLDVAVDIIRNRVDSLGTLEPEITAVPPKEVNDASLGWIVGADCTRPSSTIATCLWNCCCASASHLPLPESVRSIFTVQPWPDTNSALAVEMLPFPVRAALPR